MSKTLKWVGIIALTGLVLIGLTVSMYNGIVQLNEAVVTQRSNISVQLERRADLIPNLLNTVKAYAAHEKEIFANVAAARQKMVNAGSIAEQAAANGQMTSALGRLFAVAEAYPDLKANTNFIRLQDELAGTENRIAVVRRDYNNAAKQYNTKIKTFPAALFAGIFGFDPQEYFEAKESAQEVPKLEF